MTTTTLSAELTLHGEPARFAGGLREIAADTWAYLQPNGDLGESNAGFVVSGEHSLLVDTLWDVPLTGKMMDAASGAGIPWPQTVFNTHSDGDHFWGNQLVAEAEIIATATAKSLMHFDPPAEMRRMRSAGLAGGAIGVLPLPVVGIVKWPGLPRIPLREMAGMMKPFDWNGIDLTFPDRTFEGREKIGVGEREVELIEVGPAHTLGDAVAWVPDVQVCFAADILFIDCTPIMWAGPVASWIKAIETVLALDATIYVPGHGPVCSRAEVETLLQYFEWVRAEGVGRLERGVAPVKAARELLLSAEFEGLPWASWDDPARLVVTLITEQHRRDGGEHHLHGGARSRAVTQMQITKEALARKRKAAR